MLRTNIKIQAFIVRERDACTILSQINENRIVMTTHYSPLLVAHRAQNGLLNIRFLWTRRRRHGSPAYIHFKNCKGEMLWRRCVYSMLFLLQSTAYLLFVLSLVFFSFAFYLVVALALSLSAALFPVDAAVGVWCDVCVCASAPLWGLVPEWTHRKTFAIIVKNVSNIQYWLTEEKK